MTKQKSVASQSKLETTQDKGVVAKKTASATSAPVKTSSIKKAAPGKGAANKTVTKKKPVKKLAVYTNIKAKTKEINDLFKPNHVQIMEDIMTQNNTQFDKLTKDATAAGQAQMEALAKSGNIFAKGFEDIFKTYVSIAQTTAEKNAKSMQALMGCKTLNEYTEAQNKMAQQGFDDLTCSLTKLSEMSVKVTTEAFEPINDQVSKSIKKATDSVAA